MAWKPTTEDWRAIAAISGEIAYRVVEGATNQGEFGELGDADEYGSRCGRAAELFRQTYGEEFPPDVDEMLDHVAQLIRDGEDGWKAMRQVIKERG